MMTLSIDPIYSRIAPDYRVILIEATVDCAETPEKLTEAISRFGDQIAAIMEMPDIAKRPGIAATRAVYKALGKEPNRYRPSHEQMMRRFLKGQGLYTVSALVDAGNLLSLTSGYSVGVFDRDKVQGDYLTVREGRAGEPYEGIGRGPLNIEHLPAVCDAAGPIGTPTSDNERTKTGPDTRRIVVTIHAFGPDMPLDDTVRLASDIFTEFCGATDLTHSIIAPPQA